MWVFIPSSRAKIGCPAIKPGQLVHRFISIVLLVTKTTGNQFTVSITTNNGDDATVQYKVHRQLESSTVRFQSYLD